MLGNSLLTLAYKLTQPNKSHAHASHDPNLLGLVNAFECRFLLGTIASGGTTILMVLVSHWMNWVPNATSSYQGVPWLLYATEVMLVACFAAVYYCESSYREICHKNIDAEAESQQDDLKTPLLSAAHIV